MKRKMIRKRKNFRQAELPCIPMKEVELPGMPEAPKNVEPKISNTAMEKVTEAAALCAADPKVLRAFLDQLEMQYPADGQSVSILCILPSGKRGVNINFKMLPFVPAIGNSALIHRMGLRAMKAITAKKKENNHA